LKTTNGGETGHYGKEEVMLRGETNGDITGLKFQATDVRKPLSGSQEVCEETKIDQCGPEPEQKYIMNTQSGGKITMEKKGGSFAIEADFVKKLGGAEGFPPQAR
jgi:hypothetical protein